MQQSLAAVTLLVPDYDEGVAFFTQVLRFHLAEDVALGQGKRWVVVVPSAGGARLVLGKADGAAQAARIGDQTGGRVFLFLHTDDFWRDHAEMIKRGVRFCETPRQEAYGWVAVFEDPWGNKWDLLQPAPATAG
jgi:catechol 2,3-dioxygenase-like lactoylglutathione lyase family enzyme